MKQLIILTFLAVSLCLVAMTQPLAAEKNAPIAPPSLSVTADLLKSKIREVEANTDSSDEANTHLIELYRKALSNLEEMNANATRATTFAETTQTAPAQTQVIREKIAAFKRTDPMSRLDINLETPLEHIEQQLQKEQADLAAVDARRADFERRIIYQQNRAATISQRLVQAKQQQEQEEIAATLELPPAMDAEPALNQANRWVLESHYVALSNEIRMLDQELLSQPMRVDLLKAKRDQEAFSVAWISARVKVLSEWINRQRAHAAEQAKVEAETVQREIAGSDPLLVHLAEQNAALTEELHAMATRLEILDQEQAQAEQFAARLAVDLKEVTDTLEVGGLTEGLGLILVKQQKSLPDFRRYTLKAQARKQQIAELGVQRLRHGGEARRIADLEQTIAELEAQITVEKTPRLRAQIREGVTKRQALLKKALESDQFYLHKLRELDVAEQKLLNVTAAYNHFLNENLFWLRTGQRTRLENLEHLPDELRLLLSPAIWSHLTEVFWNQVTHAPDFWLALLVVIALLWKRRALIAGVETTAATVGNPITDRFTNTLRALGLTLVVATPLPLLLAAIGWQLRVSALGSDLAHAVGTALLHTALHFFILWELRMMCIPQGLIAAHFRWPKSSVKRLRVGFDLLTWINGSMLLVILLTIALNPTETGGTLARLGLLVFLVALSQFLYRILHPQRGILAHLRHTAGVLFRTYILWFTLLCAYPLVIAILALDGYIYSAAALSIMFVYTLWMIAGLVLLNALARRWLRVVQRSLAYEAAVERRRAALAARQTEESEAGGEEAGTLQFEEPKVDLAALSDASRELIKFMIMTVLLVGLYLIWSPLLPALHIFDDVILWYETITVNGKDQQLAITLMDLGLALIYAIGIIVLLKRLPAMLEIILLQRLNMSSGSRYTVTTLTTYAIVAIGLLLVFNTLGAQWSQLQWLAAALGVGIGFGLQEIVANFISGLILLFERPIRVGDIVTVGDTDGVVTRIRIRATTIRNWDRKELIVPNKEFITGRLLNWSLSDPITRAMIAVGVAYGSDVDKALALMKEAAAEQEHVMDDPAPILTFESFGDNALALNLRVYIDSIDYRLSTVTALHKAINRKFEHAGISIAFPQRDLHLDTNKPLRVSIEKG